MASRAISLSRYKRSRTELQLTSTIQQPTRETHKDPNFIMKIVMVLACLMALAAAFDESIQVVEDADLDVAENRRHGGYYGGQRGYGHGGYYGGNRWGRKRRSVEDEALSSDLEVAEGGHRGWGHRGGHYGGWGGRRGGYGGYGGYGYYG